mmetsp:Transcript_45148/g.94704  ORF Transcript_45148/g.94704 Transcript_45148/m.94704 type:complete len:114 (-) Transcript_45148:8-349(-)
MNMVVQYNTVSILLSRECQIVIVQMIHGCLKQHHCFETNSCTNIFDVGEIGRRLMKATRQIGRWNNAKRNAKPAPTSVKVAILNQIKSLHLCAFSYWRSKKRAAKARGGSDKR